MRLQPYTGRPYWRVADGVADNCALGQLREPGNAGTVPDANVTLASRANLYRLAGGVVALAGASHHAEAHGLGHVPDGCVESA
ncbi:hypothetical protein [Arthrobacter alpinus]|uniref:hypothetical protein n=1 Tax=Arthrobacter alpinus TaxID=656366 RepID=UPI000A612323|nr:hypothetical protein [Arthrobacter alpinus]